MAGRPAAVAAPLLVLLLLAPVGLAAYPSVTIPASTIDQVFSFQVEPPLIIKITFSGLQPDTTVDNLALSFRDNSTTPQEVFVLYVKTSGDLVLQVPIAGVTTDQLLGSWQSLGSVAVRYWADKLQVLDPSGNVLYEIAGSFPALGDIWAHSSNTTKAAFTAGDITVEGQDDPAVISRSVTEMLGSFMPMIVLMVGLGFTLAIFNRIIRMLEGLLK